MRVRPLLIDAEDVSLLPGYCERVDAGASCVKSDRARVWVTGLLCV